VGGFQAFADQLAAFLPSYNEKMPFESLDLVLRLDCQLDSAQPLVLGFSGGPDSLALLHALYERGYRLLVAHLDHGLRPESGEDARAAEKVASSLGLPFFSERADVAAAAKGQGVSVEEAARHLRYVFLFRIAEGENAQAVAVAHNADDQVETVLMHLLRGAGSAGLRGMQPRLLPNPWSTQIPLVRPLLSIWREEILEYCEANGLQPLQDPSNLDQTYFRNRLRHALLPMLDHVAPGVKTRLHHSSELLAADHALIERLTAQAWQRCLSQKGADYLLIDRKAFLSEPLALQRGLLRFCFAELRPQNRDLDFETTQRALSAIQDGASTAGDWCAGLYLFVEGERIWIADWAAALPFEWPQARIHAKPLEVPANLELNPPWRLQLTEVSSAKAVLSQAQANRDAFQAWLDLDHTGDELTLRRRLPGDYFQPLGMARGTMKLSDFMINEKMPPRARAGWPLLCKGEEIIWIPGYRLAQPYRLLPQSRRALHVHLARQN